MTFDVAALGLTIGGAGLGTAITYGTIGNDTIYGTLSRDIMHGSDGNDELNRISSSVTVGTVGNDDIYGEGGNDNIWGGDGNDLLVGGAGVDNLWGDAGADIFQFDTVSLGSIDSVKDFSVSDGDKLDIKDILVGFDPLTSVIADFIEITDSGSNSIVKVDRDGADTTYSLIQIATLTGVTGLTDEAALLASGNIIAA